MSEPTHGYCDAVEDEPAACVDELVHCWTSRGCGGCDSNPGVWSLGGTTYAFEARCILCGCGRRETHYGWQRNPDKCDSVQYSVNKYPVDHDEARVEARRQRRNAAQRAQRRAKRP